MKLISKLVKALYIRPEFIQLLEENIGDQLLDISLGDDFFFFLTTKTKLNKRDYYSKLFLHRKGSQSGSNIMRRQHTDWKKIIMYPRRVNIQNI